LHLADDRPFWTSFFKELGIAVKTSEGYTDSLKTGKKIAGAEFCAPIDSMYGHVAYLADQCDSVFMPLYLESRNRDRHTDQNYCYYTQFSGSLAYMEGERIRDKLVSPMINFSKDISHTSKILLKSLKEMGVEGITQSQISRALTVAGDKINHLHEGLVDLFQTTFSSREDISVALLGRPYVVLSDTLNKGIPDIFTRMGVDGWYQDMIPMNDNPDQPLHGLLKKVPWHFASHILRTTETVCRTQNLYPVLITAFKCAPDSFIIEYFKQIMHLFDKPYLIIQIDEHDSNVGYETRIEAALRSFRNHARKRRVAVDPDVSGILPRVQTKLDGKILLMPNWDMFVAPLIVANLRKAGVDARFLESSELTIR
jgi:predicted nucleotide-binding protein (sugar kinase/HSP70/actin superfamily)